MGPNYTRVVLMNSFVRRTSVVHFYFIVNTMASQRGWRANPHLQQSLTLSAILSRPKRGSYCTKHVRNILANFHSKDCFQDTSCSISLSNKRCFRHFKFCNDYKARISRDCLLMNSDTTWNRFMNNISLTSPLYKKEPTWCTTYALYILSTSTLLCIWHTLIFVVVVFS